LRRPLARAAPNLDRPAKGKSPLGLAGTTVDVGQDRQGLDEQVAGVQLAGQPERLFAQRPGRRDVNHGRLVGGGDQRRCEQLRVLLGFGPRQHRQEQGEGFGVAGARHPVAP